MSVVRPLSPGGLRRALEAADFEVIGEDLDGDNWLMANGDLTVPIVVPKRGRVVSVPIMERMFHLAPKEILAELQREDPQAHTEDTEADGDEIPPRAKK